jgi:predicted  nucleic acid-binding Zn-ribbon protein
MKAMMIRKIPSFGTALLLLFAVTATAQAAQLYRFPNEEGVQTLSRSLPPEAAQKGYDILDDKTMRLIERVPPALSAEEIADLEAKEAEDAERQRQADIAAKEAEKQREKAARYDRTLLITYTNEAELISARDKDIGYRKEQIELLSAKLPELRKSLEKVQKDAAERELSGGKVTANMQKRLTAAQEEIAVREQAIEIYRAEIKELNAKYDFDLQRFRILRGNSASRH